MGHPLWFRNDWHEQCFVNMAQKAGLVKCSDPDPYALGEAVADYRETGAALYLLATLDDMSPYVADFEIDFPRLLARGHWSPSERGRLRLAAHIYDSDQYGNCNLHEALGHLDEANFLVALEALKWWHARPATTPAPAGDPLAGAPGPPTGPTSSPCAG